MSVRVAVVGAGWWASNHHVPSLAAYGPAELVALCDEDRGRAAEVAHEHGVPEVVTDVDELLRVGADAVVIATPHVTHHDLAAPLLDAGVHVLVEKPLTTRATDAFDLVRRAERSGAHLAVGYTDQHAPTASRVRDAVRRDIGDLVQVMAEFSSGTAGLFARAEADSAEVTSARAGSDDGEPHDQHPRTYGAAMGGGQAHTQLTHVMGMVCWTTGREVREVAAFVDHRGREVDVDDAAAFRLVGGGTGVVTSTGMAGEAGAERRHVRYLGTRGSVDHDMTSGEATVRCVDGTTAHLSPPPEEPGRRTWAPARALVDLVRGDGENLAPGGAGAATTAFVEAMLLATETRKVVDVPRLP
ncbi:hypothetical protein GCM10023169_28150 [Georgenia halophila]|uniref:Gfo/Idh/MocA family oxidoreductase n=1 Tax=Georgenia halophila TaxID=620889 RepID=A0ABP8LF70_9MICO